MYRLAASTVLRAKTERVLIDPNDVMFQGKIMQRLGATLPDELVAQLACDGVRLFEDAGQWYAEPLWGNMQTALMGTI